MSDQTKLQEAAARLGAPHCAHCGALGEFRTMIIAAFSDDDPYTRYGCCSATCAVAFLAKCLVGTARSNTRKKNYVIAMKHRDKAVGVFPRGHEAMAAEFRIAERARRRGGRA